MKIALLCLLVVAVGISADNAGREKRVATARRGVGRQCGSSHLCRKGLKCSSGRCKHGHRHKDTHYHHVEKHFSYTLKFSTSCSPHWPVDWKVDPNVGSQGLDAVAYKLNKATLTGIRNCNRDDTCHAFVIGFNAPNDPFFFVCAPDFVELDHNGHMGWDANGKVATGNILYIKGSSATG